MSYSKCEYCHEMCLDNACCNNCERMYCSNCIREHFTGYMFKEDEHGYIVKVCAKCLDGPGATGPNMLMRALSEGLLD